MKRLFWALPILLLGISASAFADSITIGLSPNNGSGDNFGFSLIQPGFVVEPDGFHDKGIPRPLAYGITEPTGLRVRRKCAAIAEDLAEYSVRLVQDHR